MEGERRAGPAAFILVEAAREPWIAAVVRRLADVEVLEAATGAEAVAAATGVEAPIVLCPPSLPDMAPLRVLRLVAQADATATCWLVGVETPAALPATAEPPHGTIVAGATSEAIEASLRCALQARARLVAIAAEAQAALQEADDFTYTVTHDLKGPLQGVVGLAGLLCELEGHYLSEDGLAYLGRIEESGAYLARQLDELLRYSRLGRAPVRSARVALGPMIEGIFEAFAGDEELGGAMLQIDRALPVVAADPDKMALMLEHLLANAVRHNPAPERRVSVSWQAGTGEGKSGDGLTLSITDNGPGIPEHARERVFEIFHRLGPHDYGAIGSGLTLARKVAAMHRGLVWIETAPGGGCALRVALPVPVLP